MYTLKSIARRGTLLVAAVVLLAATVLPALPAYADALNPLTERSLALSSGSPGWSYLDASGNPTYSPPNSGPNGRNTGNTFAFRVSTDSSATGTNNDIDAFTFQYCTTSAGNCRGPGNNECATGTTGGGDCARKTNAQALADDDKTSDLEVVTATPTEVSAANYTALFDEDAGAPATAADVPNRDNSEGNFIVLYKEDVSDPWSQSEGWDMAASLVQTGTEGAGTATDKNNYMTITNDGTGLALPAGGYVKIIFFGTDTNYITNPGAGAFFVKINSYNSDLTQDSTTLVDGGVTVANVMNLSIEIQTKVLETMQFSVGVVDPNTLDSTDPDTTGPLLSELKTANGNDMHTICDSILPGMTASTTTPNILQMGNEDGEFSLETDDTYITHSYWRLSSNSSAGATVYYSGVTLSNTVNDQIDPIGTTAEAPTPGAEQFGLALANGTGPNYEVDYDVERFDADHLFENAVDNGKTAIHTASLTADGVIANESWHTPQLFPLIPATHYGDGAGVVNADWNGGSVAIDTSFAFDPNSTVIPVPIASESTDVVDCVTGKIRYIANIAATTPAGIYTTKINWIAAPQY